MTETDVGRLLAQRIASAVKEAFSHDITPVQALIRPSSAERGSDYQANVAMSLAKQLQLPSRDVAQRIVEHLNCADIVEKPEIAGPGFINFSLRTSWLERHVADFMSGNRLGVSCAAPLRFVIDYGSPNVAKEMHVGHLRSTVIGDSLVRVLEFRGHSVVRRNHLGDWGTPFGMLLEHLVDEGWTAGAQHSLGDLNAFYQAAREKSEKDTSFARRARLRVVALQSGDPATLELWKELVAESERHFERVYELLDVRLSSDDIYGESFYNPFLAETVAELETKGLASISDDALCVFPPGFTGRDGKPAPLIIRKSDGGYTYGTTDLAAVRYWTQQRDATDLLYVVGLPQRQHFQMIFATAAQAGWLDDDRRAVHIGFGSILGEDGRMFRSRSGQSIKLVDLLEEAIERAAVVMAERTELGNAERREIARSVGIGAVKYADLATDREKDYHFSWDRMLAMDGNTSVYLQYANARIKSVLRKAGKALPADGQVTLLDPAERALAIKLGQFPAAIDAVIEGFVPHKLCGYLYELATTFSRFYENCPVIGAETEKLQGSRLVLCELTSRVLTVGLGLLGISAPERL